jgi:hypothetical protein
MVANPAKLVIMASLIKEVSVECLPVMNYNEIFMLAISVKKLLNNQDKEVENPQSLDFVDCVDSEYAGKHCAGRGKSSNIILASFPSTLEATKAINIQQVSTCVL